jgi:hypothetical protein
VVSGREPTISGDGARVAFVSREALVPGVPAGTENVYVRDLATGHTKLASELNGVAANDDSEEPAISGNGQVVAFASKATDLGGPLGAVYAHDLQSGETVLVSRATGAAGEPANQESLSPSIDAEGTHVTFGTTATNLDPADKDAVESFYERDLAHATTTLATQSSGGAPNNMAAFSAVVSGDGTRVAFSSAATNLVPEDTSTNIDIFVRDLAAKTTTLVSQPYSPTFGAGSFDISEDGSTVSWITPDRVLAEDTDNTNDLYARDLASGTTSLIGRGGDGAPLAASVERAGLNADASCVAIALGGPNEDEEGLVASPGLPGSTPSPDFDVVIVRALKRDCLPSPPVEGSTAAPPPTSGVGPRPLTGGGSTADRTPPVLSRVSLTNQRFRRSARATATTAARRPANAAKVGTTLRFTLSETATVTVAFERASSGRRLGTSCQAPTARLRAHKPCTRYVHAGTLTRRALRAGARQIAFSGRLGAKALAPGSYRVTLIATDAAGNRSRPHRLSFTIVA